MAEKPLKGINFPGLDGTYEIPQVDYTLTVSGAAADAKKVGDALANKADAIEDTDWSGCYYHMVDGEKEWINPPLFAGIEYRTTERYIGRPVYVKTVSVGYLAEKGKSKSEIYCSGGASDILRVQPFVYSTTGNRHMLPFFTTDGSLKTTFHMTKYSVIFNAVDDNTSYSGECTIWYTKGF